MWKSTASILPRQPLQNGTGCSRPWSEPVRPVYSPVSRPGLMRMQNCPYMANPRPRQNPPRSQHQFRPNTRSNARIQRRIQCPIQRLIRQRPIARTYRRADKHAGKLRRPSGAVECTRRVSVCVYRSYPRAYHPDIASFCPLARSGRCTIRQKAALTH